MWTFNSDYNKWVTTSDVIIKSNFDYLKQELSSTRFYSKCLSGATYLPVNRLDNIYDILGQYQPRNWFVSTLGSQYSDTLIPSNYSSPITDLTYTDYNKYLSEYGLTLKNLFTPDRLIKDSIKNFIYVDVATTMQIDNITATFDNLTIDGVRLINGHRLLVKDQVSIEFLPFTTDPKTYFKGNYTVIQDYGATIEYSYYNSENGIYLFNNNKLTKTDELSLYDDCIRYSVSVKLGTLNTQKQFHLSRLLNGYYPTTSLNEPIEFKEKHNWLLRNRVDYNNLFEINYYDIVKYPAESFNLEGITYSIPERTIAIGEFGVILNTQYGLSNIIPNKYKVNLRSISSTDEYYWICGDNGTLLKVSKKDFSIELSVVDTSNNLKSISFFDNLKGVTVGDLNTILITKNGGMSWDKIIVDDFLEYYYNKVIFYSDSNIYIVGNTGVFLELQEDINGWDVYKRRVSRFIDDYEEYLLVDNINDVYRYKDSNWGLTFSYYTETTNINKELLVLVTNNSHIIIYDVNDCIPHFDFIYLDFYDTYGDISNITSLGSKFYFTYNNNGVQGINSFDLHDFTTIGVNNLYSNTSTITFGVTNEITGLYPNKIFNYNDLDLLICGNTSLLQTSIFTSTLSFNILDPTFESRLKSKMLFLDYDIASKLNFFTDAGDYRLPSSINFNFNQLLTDGISLTAGKANLWFEPLVYGATAPSFMTQSETNWLTYWKDTDKTFTYYSNVKPLDESTKVEISTTFSYIQQIPQLSFLGADNTIDQISRLAPSILDNENSKFNGLGGTPIAAPTSLSNLYLYDYIMIIKAPDGFPVSIGDVIRLESDVVDGNFVVNRVENLFTSANNQFSKFVPKMYRYIYVFTNFNDNIITNLVNSTNYINITNLNIYSTVDELESNFNLHPISNAYQLSYDNNVNDPSITISAKFNNLTSYYNLATKVLVGDPYVFDYQNMIYTDRFLKFGYTPTYNILDYLQGLNDLSDPLNPKFYADKEYSVMPVYKSVPLSSTNGFTSNSIYIDVYTNDNKIYFGTNLKLEWETILINTFVDITIYDLSNIPYTTERLLVMNKYYQSTGDPSITYVIEFHKKIKKPSTTSTIDIVSRRKLLQISQDLQELNNIQRAKLQKHSGIGFTSSTSEFYDYDRELNFKIPTDSYAKILLSDVNTVRELSALIYIDYKNELAMNITRLEKQYNIPILDTADYNSNLLVICSSNHDLKTGDSVVLEFNGGTHSSQYLNQQYFGYHNVTVVDPLRFYIDVPYSQTTVADTGSVKYVKRDPFLNYQPIDITDIGIDKKGKQAIELSINNLILTGDIYSLTNVDFNKFRFRLVDGLTLETLSLNYSWILEAEITDAIIGTDNNGLLWYKGNWECGRWFGGTWTSGVWKSGDWYGGIWNSKKISDNLITVDIANNTSDTIQSTWYTGRWYDGTWNNGTWIDGRWYAGTWNSGNWYKGIWNDGTWNTGVFSGGVWVTGTWNGGILNCNNDSSFWINGKWNGGDFENGMWYNGTFEERNSVARFGTKAFNSRTATWHGGQWLSGSFYSRLYTDNSGLPEVSESHKYSIWHTGNWYSGNLYGGIVYNIDFKSGTWHGGILEEIQIIGIDTVSTNKTLKLNGLFRFNIGDEISILGNNSLYQSYFTTDKYKIIYSTVNTVDKTTTINIDFGNVLPITTSLDSETNMRVVSRFRNIDWRSGIWTNGIFETGLWKGGIWYNGIFGEKAKWN